MQEKQGKRRVQMKFCKVFDNGFDKYLNVLLVYVMYIMAIIENE